MDMEVKHNSQGDKYHDQEVEQSLFAKREKIYPREVHGTFAFLRLSAVFVLLGLYYGLPWISWDGRQSVLFDLPERKFYIFNLTLWPQDFLNLALLMMIAAVSLFFFTALAGRLWCGYSCPQTVWTEVFIWIERMIEGDRRDQMKLDNLPMWDAERVRKKAIKHASWFLIAAFTGFTFVAYFTPATQLVQDIYSFQVGGWEIFWIGFYTFATYGNAGWMREQVCTYMCPYARFQSAMFDDNTFIVSYDAERGEPRGGRKASDDFKKKGLGACIDCTMCVQVCPTGIDIRDGLQYKCITCSSCIDACDEVMEKMGYAKGLIKYTTQNAIQHKPSKILRLRIVIYGAVLLTLMSIFLYSMFNREITALDIIRDRNQLYRETEGLIENVYTFRIMNKDNVDHEYRISSYGIIDLELDAEMNPVLVGAGEVLSLTVRARVDESRLTSRSNDVAFAITDVNDRDNTIAEQARFLGP